MIRLTSILAAVALTPAFSATPATACPGCGCEATTTASADASAAAHAHTHAAEGSHASHEAPEQDRAAILAMAGEYRVTFQFQETVGMAPGYELRDPYHSEATEFIEVIEDTGDFISLQHVLVVEGKDGGDPHVVKHWRQDWTYQDTDILAFRGNRTWEHQTLAPERAAGTWSQAVYQVDDSPRYESFGAWTHVGGRSAWESAETWRPLPRREYTKRHDYQVMVARNRHTLTPGGWVHEQDNRKLVLDEQGRPQTVLAHESGLNVYDRTDDVDFSAGRLYWEQTAAYWEDVREIWSDTFERHETLTLRSKVEGQRLHAALFALADSTCAEGHRQSVADQASATIESFVARDN